MSDAALAWLRAQLDDDERVAREATDGPWEISASTTSPIADVQGVTSSYEDYTCSIEDAEHIARWDPARVLAEIEAKRAILDWLVDCEVKAFDGNWWSLEVGDAIRALAQPYADRPDFPEEWR